jgi:hypothetical protein
MHGKGRKSRETVGHSLRPVLWLDRNALMMLIAAASGVKARGSHVAD